MRFRILTQVRIGDLVDADLKWLQKAGEDTYGYGPQWTLDQIAAGKLACFRIGEHKGLMQIEIRVHPKGKELWVCGIAGEDIIRTKKQRDTLWSDVELMARAADCRWIGASALLPSLVRVYGSSLLRKSGTLFLKEIE